MMAVVLCFMTLIAFGMALPVAEPEPVAEPHCKYLKFDGVIRFCSLTL